MTDVRDNPDHLRVLEEWLRSYRPEELFDEDGALMPELAALAPEGERRMGANPHAKRGALCATSSCPTSATTPWNVPSPRRPRPRRRGCSVASSGIRRPQSRTTSGSSGRMRRRRTGSATSSRSRAGRGTQRRILPTKACRRTAASWRSSPSTSARAGRGLSPHRQARPLQLLRGVHPHRRLDVQPAREAAQGTRTVPWRRPIASLNYCFVACLAPGPQRLLASGPGSSTTS